MNVVDEILRLVLEQFRYFYNGVISMTCADDFFLSSEHLQSQSKDLKSEHYKAST
jgi:hypothetical protein